MNSTAKSTAVGLRNHFQLFQSVLPTWLSRAGLRFLLIIDVLIIGTFAPTMLASVGIAYSICGVFYAIAFGLLIGCLVQIVSANVQNDETRAMHVMCDALLFALVFGILLGIFAQFGKTILAMLGQSTHISSDGGMFMSILGFGIPLHYVIVAVMYTLEAFKRHVVVALLIGLSFATNLIVSMVLASAYHAQSTINEANIAEATAWVTIGVRFALMIVAVYFAFRLFDWKLVALQSWQPFHWSRGRKMRQLGYATGASIAVEAAAFAALAVFAGWLGETELASYALLNNLVSLIFSMALAIGVITSAHVAGAAAQNDRNGVTSAFQSGMLTALVIMAATGALAFIARDIIVGYGAADPAVVEVATPLVWLVAFLMLGDGGQSVANHALRGLGDVWPATLIHLACYLILMTVGGWVLAVWLERGVAGLIEATAIASFTVLGLLTLRFYSLARRQFKIAASSKGELNEY